MEQIRDTIARYPWLAPALGGLLAHLICHHIPPASLIAFASVILLVPIALTAFSQPASPIAYVLQTTAIYLFTLGVSISAYRLSPFHPLAKYPGPVLARISRLWATQSVIRGYQHLESRELFEKYGEVVRTGPNHLIICNASALPVIHSAKDRWPRHDQKQVTIPYHTKGPLISVVDPAEHSQRRRIWDRAFTASAVKSYEPMLQGRLDQLINSLVARTNTPINISEWFELFSIDFMGDFAFGGMFNTMAHGEDVTGLHKSMNQLLRFNEILGTIPWIRPIVLRLPKTKAKEMLALALGLADQRKKQGSQTRDLFYYLLHEDQEGGQDSPKMSPMDMSEDALLAMSAGSDTTSGALSAAMYYIISSSAVFTRLRAELDAVAREEGASFDAPLNSDRLAQLKYLQAVINETLRLDPAVPSGIQSTAHADHGPLPVAGYVIPPSTTVQIPTWSLHRDARYFSPEPEVFWPERWLPEEGPKIAEARGQDFKLSQGAYMPFHYGPANCVGKSLALHELRTVLSALIRRFDFKFAPGFEGGDWINHSTDQFILLRGELRVVMTERK